MEKGEGRRPRAQKKKKRETDREEGRNNGGDVCTETQTSAQVNSAACRA